MAHRVRSGSVRTGHPVGFAIILKVKRWRHLGGPHSRAMTSVIEATIESYSKRPPPRQDFPEHFAVAHEAVDRLLEGGGPVLFKNEMREPGKAIAAQQARQYPIEIA